MPGIPRPVTEERLMASLCPAATSSSAATAVIGASGTTRVATATVRPVSRWLAPPGSTGVGRTCCPPSTSTSSSPCPRPSTATASAIGPPTSGRDSRPRGPSTAVSPYRTGTPPARWPAGPFAGRSARYAADLGPAGRLLARRAAFVMRVAEWLYRAYPRATLCSRFGG